MTIGKEILSIAAGPSRWPTSPTASALFGAWGDPADWDQLVDAIVDSCEVGMLKPEHRVFDHTCDALGVKANQAPFLYDMQANVDAAADLGIEAVRVQAVIRSDNLLPWE